MIRLFAILFFVALFSVSAYLVIGNDGLGGEIILPNPIVAPVSKMIDGRQVSIDHTDENIGENLIIKTSNEKYLNVFGNFNVIYSVTNISGKDQMVKTLFAFKDSPDKYVRSIAVYDGEQMVDVEVPKYKEEVTATGTKQVLDGYETIKEERTIWTPTELKEPDVLGGVKDIGDTVLNKGNEILIANGETKFFKANIKYIGLTNEEEFFITAFGNKGAYGHLR